MTGPKVDMNWISFITGASEASDLTPENTTRLEAEQADRAECIAGGDVPCKPFPGGIVGVGRLDEAE